MHRKIQEYPDPAVIDCKSKSHDGMFIFCEMNIPRRSEAMTMRPKGNDRFRSGFDGGLLQSLSGNSHDYGYGNSAGSPEWFAGAGLFFAHQIAFT